MSKLPRLSNTSENTPPPAPRDSAAPDTPAKPPAAIAYGSGWGTALGAEVWLSLILGLVFILIGKNFGIYLADTAMHRTYHTEVTWVAGPHAGQEVAYPQLQGFVMLTDASLFLFGLALFLDGIMLIASATSTRFRKPLIYLGFAVTVIAVVFNVYACGRIFAGGLTPIISLLAVAFGVYIAIYQWGMIRAASRR